MALERGCLLTVIFDIGGNSMKQCMDSENLHRRLKKIVGQVQAIDRMVDEDIPCEDVLAQINAAKSALHKVGQVVLEGHIQHCVRDGIEHGDADKTIENFTKAVERNLIWLVVLITFLVLAVYSFWWIRTRMKMPVFRSVPIQKVMAMENELFYTIRKRRGIWR